MVETQIRLRPAKPTLDDGRHFAHYLDEAAEGFFQFLLGARCVEKIAQAFVQPAHDLSFEHVMFAESSDEVVGMSVRAKSPNLFFIPRSGVLRMAKLR